MILFIAGTNAFAQEAGGSQFGAVYGLSVPDADNTNAHKLFGAKGSAFLKPTFSIGGYYFVADNDQGTGGREFDYSLSGLETTFHMPAGTGDTFFGIRFGLTKVKTDFSGEEVILSPYHYGIVAGYDYLMAPWLAIGFEGSYLYVEDSNTTKNSIRYDEDTFSTIHFLVTLQLRL